MELFKVCSADQKIKKIIYGAKDVKDLKEKARVKLGLASAEQLVMVTDGYEVEDDAPLEFFKGQELMVLQAGENWQPVQSTSNILPQETAGDQLITPILLHTSGQGDKAEPEGKAEEEQSQNKADSADEDASTLELERAPLPIFTGLVKEALEQRDPSTVWNKLVLQTAQHFFPMLQNPTSFHYKIIGQRMYKRYPCIGLPGAGNPWMAFNKTLAQKVRHMKHDLKARSKKAKPHPLKEVQQYCVGPQAKKRQYSLKSSALQVDDSQQEEDTESHLQVLREECRKDPDCRNTAHLRTLLKHTHAFRQDLLKNHHGGDVQPILEHFPCLDQIDFVMYDFGLKFGPERYEEMLEKITCLREMAVKSMKSKDADTCTDELTSWRRIEDIVRFTKGKSRSSSVIKIIEVEMLHDAVEKKQYVGPSMLLVEREGALTDIKVAVDSSLISCATTSVDKALVHLICVYYNFDIEYPRVYSQVLGLIQHVVMCDPFRGVTSQGYKFLLKNIENTS